MVTNTQFNIEIYSCTLSALLIFNLFEDRDKEECTENKDCINVNELMRPSCVELKS